MKREEKKKALEFVETLGDAHKIIERIAGEGNDQQAKELLAQCQEGAIALGELIEAKASEHVDIVTLLEDYCEDVWQLYDALDQKMEIETKLQKQIEMVGERIQQEIKT